MVNKAYRYKVSKNRSFKAENVYKWVLLFAFLVWFTYGAVRQVRGVELYVNDMEVPSKSEVKPKPIMVVSNSFRLVDIQKYVTFEVDFNSLPYEEKIDYVRRRLEFNGIIGDDQELLIKIFHLESCRNSGDVNCMNTSKVPITMVYHCQRPDGGYSAVEIKRSGNLNVQAYCEDYGWTQSGSEQSVGMAQILVSTWNSYQCDGAIRDYIWYQQVDCAVKIYNRSGANAWSSNVLVDGYSNYVK